MKRSTWLVKSFLLAAMVAAGPAVAQNNAAGGKPAGGGAKQKAEAHAAMAKADLIPRSVLFGNPDKAAGRVSPDGKKVSFLAPVDGVLNVWVGPADDISKAKAVTSDTQRGIRQYFWAFTNDHILYLQDKGGDENWKVYAVNLESGETKDLTPFETIPGPDGKPIEVNGTVLRPTARVEGLSERLPGEILVGLNNRSPQFHDVYRVNIATGDMELVQQNDGYAGFVTDDDYNVRMALQMTPDGGMQYFMAKKDAPGEFEEWQKVAMEDSVTTGPAGFDKTGKVLYMTDSRGRNTGALTAVDLETGKQTVLAQDPRADAGGVLAHPTEKTIQAGRSSTRR
jgi:hypothetical protein